MLEERIDKLTHSIDTLIEILRAQGVAAVTVGGSTQAVQGQVAAPEKAAPKADKPAKTPTLADAVGVKEKAAPEFHGTAHLYHELNGYQVATTLSDFLAALSDGWVEVSKDEYTKAVAAQAEAAQPDSTPAHAQKAAAANPEADYEEAKKLVLEVARVKGRDAAVDVLSRYGAQRLPDVLPQHYAAIIVDARAALETEEA
jgi:hypothetical protein